MSIVGYNPLPPMDEITVAVVETARLAADQWDRPPRLYALARRADLSSLEPRMSPRARKAAPSALIPIAQDSLPEGDPMQVLARIRWPPTVPGCVLVTEVRIVPSGGGQQEEQARLSVGVLRNGREVVYTCCLQRRGSDELTISTDLADDLVTALLGTLATSESAS